MEEPKQAGDCQLISPRQGRQVSLAASRPQHPLRERERLERSQRLQKKEAAQSKPPRPPKTKSCHPCRKVCLRLMAQYKQLKKDHRDTPISRKGGPKRYKKRSNRKRQNMSPAARARLQQGERAGLQPRPLSLKSPSLIQKPSEQGGRRQGDKDVRKSQEPQLPSSPEFATSSLQEPFEQGLEYVIPLEGLDYQEDTRPENPGPDGKRGGERGQSSSGQPGK